MSRESGQMICHELFPLFIDMTFFMKINKYLLFFFLVLFTNLILDGIPKGKVDCIALWPRFTQIEWIQMLNLATFPIKNSVRMCRISRVSRKFVKQVNWFDVLWTRKLMQKSSRVFFLKSYIATQSQKFVVHNAYPSLVDEWKSTNYPSRMGWNKLWTNE